MPDGPDSHTHTQNHSPCISPWEKKSWLTSITGKNPYNGNALKGYAGVDDKK